MLQVMLCAICMMSAALFYYDFVIIPRQNRSIICRGITGETTTSMEVCSSRQTVFWENREI